MTESKGKNRSVWRLYFSLSLLIQSNVGSYSSESDDECEETKFFRDDSKNRALMEQCELFIAESSLDVNELGTFTGKSMKPFENIGESEVYISLPDKTEDTFLTLGDESWGVDIDYLLQSNNLYGSTEFVPGMGSLATSYIGLVNAQFKPEQLTSDSAGLHRYSDPGLGAITNHYGMIFETTEYVPAGSELFLDYGDEWYEDRKGRTKMPATTSEDYMIAEREVQKALTDRLTQKEWNKRRMQLQKLEQNLWKVLPRYIKDFEEFIRVGAAKYAHPHGTNGNLRSLNWLRNHGWCVSHLRPGKSLIPQAGRGAFAKLNLPLGTIVAPAPMFVIDKKDTFMHEMYENTFGEIVEEGEKSIGTQLIINYCFGHPDSDVLLLPFTTVVNLINHAPSPEKANVALRWTTTPGPHQDSDLLAMDQKEILQIRHSRLMMEFVAIRDINEGEEILIDYGDDWSSAWSTHLSQWSSKESDRTYISATDFVKSHPEDYVRTIYETKTNPYPSNLETFCYYQHQESHSVRKLRGGQSSVVRKWNSLIDNKNCLLPCNVISPLPQKNSGTITYIVELNNFEITENQSDTCILPNIGKYVVSGIPLDHIKLVDKPYTSDQFIDGAFRHFMGVPEDIFPKAWKTHN